MEEIIGCTDKSTISKTVCLEQMYRLQNVPLPLPCILDNEHINQDQGLGLIPLRNIYTAGWVETSVLCGSICWVSLRPLNGQMEHVYLAQSPLSAVAQSFSDFADALWTCDGVATGRPTPLCGFWLTTDSAEWTSVWVSAVCAVVLRVLGVPLGFLQHAVIVTLVPKSELKGHRRCLCSALHNLQWLWFKYPFENLDHYHMIQFHSAADCWHL